LKETYIQFFLQYRSSAVQMALWKRWSADRIKN